MTVCYVNILTSVNLKYVLFSYIGQIMKINRIKMESHKILPLKLICLNIFIYIYLNDLTFIKRKLDND